MQLKTIKEIGRSDVSAAFAVRRDRREIAASLTDVSNTIAIDADKARRMLTDMIFELTREL